MKLEIQNSKGNLKHKTNVEETEKSKQNSKI